MASSRDTAKGRVKEATMKTVDKVAGTVSDAKKKR